MWRHIQLHLYEYYKTCTLFVLFSMFRLLFKCFWLMMYCFKLTILAEICIKNAFFLLRNCKNRSALEASPLDPFASRPGCGLYSQHPAAEGFFPKPSMASGGWGFFPQTPAITLPPLWIPSYANEGRNWKFWSLIGKNSEKKTLRSTGLILSQI